MKNLNRVFLDVPIISDSDNTPTTLMQITNLTKMPLGIPLPAGKKLFLGPGKSGQINWKAAKYPAVLKLIESGKVKVAQGQEKGSKARGGGHIDTSAPCYTGSFYSAN